MSILIKHNFGFIFEEIWETFLLYPKGVYIELIQNYYENLNYDLEGKLEIINNEDLASDEFREIPSWPIHETICIKILEEFYSLLIDSYDVKLADTYRTNLIKIFERLNLRYTMLTNGKMGLSIQGLLGSMLLRLKTTVRSKTSLESLEQLEKSVAKLENSDESFRSCMTIACNLMEGTAKDRANNRFDTLKRSIDSIPDVFPHDSMKESIKQLYDYLSDYPNLRHSGTEANRIRNLKMDDASLVTALAIGYASYLASCDDGQSILIGEF